MAAGLSDAQEGIPGPQWALGRAGGCWRGGACGKSWGFLGRKENAAPEENWKTDEDSPHTEPLGQAEAGKLGFHLKSLCASGARVLRGEAVLLS